MGREQPWDPPSEFQGPPISTLTRRWRNKPLWRRSDMGRQLGLGTLVQLNSDRLPRVLGPTPPRHFWVGTARQLEELRVLVRVDIDLHSVINSWKNQSLCCQPSRSKAFLGTIAGSWDCAPGCSSSASESRFQNRIVTSMFFLVVNSMGRSQFWFVRTLPSCRGEVSLQDSKFRVGFSCNIVCVCAGACMHKSNNTAHTHIHNWFIYTVTLESGIIGSHTHKGEVDAWMVAEVLRNTSLLLSLAWY